MNDKHICTSTDQITVENLLAIPLISIELIDFFKRTKPSEKEIINSLKGYDKYMYELYGVLP